MDGAKSSGMCPRGAAIHIAQKMIDGMNITGEERHQEVKENKTWIYIDIYGARNQLQ